VSRKVISKTECAGLLDGACDYNSVIDGKRLQTRQRRATSPCADLNSAGRVMPRARGNNR
jgi:hypothetical protein